MSCWKFFSSVVSRDLMDFSMTRESWFTLTITGLSLFFVGATVAFEPFETLLSSTVADTITETHDSHRINHMIRDEWILKGNLFTLEITRSVVCWISAQLSVSYCHRVLAIVHQMGPSLNTIHFPASHPQPIMFLHIFVFIPRLFSRTNPQYSIGLHT